MMGSEKSDHINTDGWEDPLFDNAFLVEKKLDYVKTPKNYEGQDEEVCIICKIIRKDKDVERLEIFRNDHIIAFLNIYPYTSGHLLLSPINHHKAYQDLNGEELREFNIVLQRILVMLEHYGGTKSFNVGWNQGRWSGGSITHFHAHIVPRYKNDINFVDIIAKSRPVLQSLEKVEQDLEKYQPFLAGKKALEDLFESV